MIFGAINEPNCAPTTMPAPIQTASEKKTLPKKQVSSKKYAKEEKALVIDENKYKKQDLIIQEHNLSRSTDQFERLQFGNYKAITIKNTNKYDVYMNSIDLHNGIH